MKEMNEKSYRRTVRVTAVIFFIVIIVPLFLILRFHIRHTFSASKWEKYPEKRRLIVSDMLEKYPLVGMSEDEVVALLGEEDGGNKTGFKISKAYYPPDSTLVYYLGRDRLEYVWLIVSLDNGTVYTVEVDVT